MATVNDILEKKGRDVHRVQREDTVFQAVETMAERNVGSLLVMQGEEICGIITERDYLKQIALKGRSSRETKVGDIMTTNVCVAREDDSVESAMAMMTEVRCRHLPIMGASGLCGIISIGDLVKQLVQDQEAQIRHLNDYIQGRYPG